MSDAARVGLAAGQAVDGPAPRVKTPLWQGGWVKQAVAAAAFPVFWLLNRPSAAWFTRGLYDVALRANGVAINFKGRHGLNSAEEQFLLRIAPALQGGILFDVGANHGSYAAFLARLAPEAKIYAFEPHPGTFAKMAARVGGARVHPVQQALSDCAGSMELYDFRSHDGSTQASLSRDALGIFDDDLVAHRVTCNTLDDFMAAHDIQRLTLLKIDTEGFDLNVLKGAAKAIRDRRIDTIQFEFIPANIATRVTMRDFFEALPGYDIYRLCLNGSLLPLFPYSVKHCEIYVTQNLIARPRP